MDVVVYGRNNCIQCRYTTKELDKLGVPYIYVDLDEDQDANAAAEATGITRLPIVVTGQGMWGGFKIDKLRKLVHQ